MTTELRPCPFCGMAPEARGFTVSCENAWCEAQPTTAGQALSEAIAAWNKRPAPPEPDEITRLRAEVEALRLPAEPSPGLLMSMAVRFDHGLGIPGYYDQVASLCGVGVPMHAQRVESALRLMRQLYEEVAGHGFYRPEREAEYAALKEHTNGR